MTKNKRDLEIAELIMNLLISEIGLNPDNGTKLKYRPTIIKENKNEDTSAPLQTQDETH